MIFEIIFIMASTFYVVYGQCDGSPRDLSPNASNSSTPELCNITSPHYPNEYNKTADCEWTISGTGYSYEISFIEKDLHFQDPYGRNYCSGSYVIAVNGEDIDCLWPTDQHIVCLAFQQRSCGGSQINPNCKSKTYHSDTLRLTYKSDGRTSDNQNVTGFNMTIKFTKCPSEANSTEVPTTTATSPHLPTHNISTATTETHHQSSTHETSTESQGEGDTTTTKGHPRTIVHEKLSPSQSTDVSTATRGSHNRHTQKISTATESEAQPPSTTLDWQTIVITMGAGFGFLLIAMIALLLYLLYRRSNASPPESQQPPNSEVTEMQPPPEPYYETPYEPPLSNSAQYEF